MARPLKNNADYFPHEADLRNDRRCKALRNRFGAEGYGIFIMLLEALANAEHFEITYNTLEIELLAGDFEVSAEKLEEIIKYLLDVELLQQTEDRITSSILADLKQILSESREKERKRKTNGKQPKEIVFPTENFHEDKHEKVFHTENTMERKVFRLENTQRKVNESKEKEIKENIIQGEAPDFNFCKDFFLKEAKGYYWEAKDDTNLVQLLKKIQVARADVGIKFGFQQFITNLPAYWRTKKFTIQHLNVNFNEIKTEMTVKNDGKKFYVAQKQSAYNHHTGSIPANTDVKQNLIVSKTNELTPQQQQEVQRNLINRVCEEYENYCKTGNFNIWPMRLAFELFVKENILQLSDEHIKNYEAKAVERRKQELSKPQSREEKFKFKTLLDSYANGINQNEQGRIERLKQELAVLDFLKHCKENNIDFKNLFIQNNNRHE
jgi:hypothetical protein